MTFLYVSKLRFLKVAKLQAGQINLSELSSKGEEKQDGTKNLILLVKLLGVKDRCYKVDMPDFRNLAYLKLLRTRATRMGNKFHAFKLRIHAFPLPF